MDGKTPSLLRRCRSHRACLPQIHLDRTHTSNFEFGRLNHLGDLDGAGQPSGLVIGVRHRVASMGLPARI